MLSVGIVGLPNVGKSTLFNAITAGHAHVSNYPFTTIDSNQGVVAVPDARLAELESLLGPEECVPCHIDFIDIAGLVEGASRGEGLGNRFLGAIREVDAIAHVLRCFEGTEVAHVFATVDPVRDAQVVETELLLADLQLLERTIEKRKKVWKTKPKAFSAERERLGEWLEHLEAGRPLRTLDLDAEQEREVMTLGLLSGRRMIYVANVAESDVGSWKETEALSGLARAGSGKGEARVVPVSAEIEWEISQLEPEERVDFMSDLGIEESGLNRLAEAAFDLLGLIRFYTIVRGKLRAWELLRGVRAPEAAGKIHGDMEHGFIRAHVASWRDLIEHGTFQDLHHAGKLRTEGKDYVVQDGDVVEFLFTS